MKTIRLYKAEPIGKSQDENPISVTIIIDDSLPDWRYQSMGLNDVEKHFDIEADKLVDALYHSLPQGTFDRVAMKMFGKKLSLYVGITDS